MDETTGQSQRLHTILHCDANNFYASVECMLDPSLRDKYVAVSGNPDKRHGIILAKNQAAKQMGVRTGDVIWEAKRKCPRLILVPPQYDEYVRISQRLFELYSEYTDRVEPFGIDECWLDVTQSRRLFGDGKTIADTLRKRVREELGLTISVGVSYNKIFAKLGSDYRKPDATTEITPDNYRQIVWPLPVADLLMIGRKTRDKLDKIGVRTIGQLAATGRTVLERMFGINGVRLYEYANGLSDAHVRLCDENRIPKSVGNSTTLPRNVCAREEVCAVVLALCEMVAIRMRRYRFAAQGVHLGLKYEDLTYESKQSRLCVPTAHAMQLADAAMGIYDASFAGARLPIRAISVTAYDLRDSGACVQLSLLDDFGRGERHERLDEALDRLRDKYGYRVVRPAAVLEFPFLCEDLKDGDFLPFRK